MAFERSIRLQSSIEFLVLMAAMASMSAIGLFYYSGVHSMISNSVDSYNAAQQQPNASEATSHYNYTINAYLFSPELELGKASRATLLVSTPIFSNVSISANASEILITPNDTAGNSDALGYSYEFYLDPIKTGESNITFGITARNGSAVIEKSVSLGVYAYSPSQGTSANNASGYGIPYVYLEPESEFIDYPLGKSSDMYYITESSRCSILNFMGGQAPIQEQCGDASWYFWTFSSSCYYGSAQVPTKTYCIYKRYSGYNASQIGENSSYLYNVSLKLEYKGNNMDSQFNQGASSFELRDGNNTAGNVSVTNSIYAVPVLADEYLIRSKNKTLTEPYSNYTDLESLYSTLVSDLAYYNNSDYGGGTVDREIYAYNSAFYRNINSTQNLTSACSAENQGNMQSYVCKPESQLEFENISIDVYNYSGKPYVANYYGSQITVH
ncbi:MAG: hypothetical protein M1544_01440 [Candidatus Marsarchaeota archaeon]|nr:hypothetical protein [Candidatus Marsarchaeota archaeon]MCL5102001.1 hypothetical protein [Candidatus Marsarchaeota archaeon]